MSCDRCIDLCQDVPIRSPRELEKVLRVVAANLQDGTILELAGGESSTRFPEIAGTSPWPDIVHSDFECPECGETFYLRCETYHGAGGHWSHRRGD